jgi:ribonuclease T2
LLVLRPLALTQTAFPPAYYSPLWQAVRAFAMLPGQRGTPDVITKNVGGSVSTAALRAAYAKRVALSADKQCRLTEVTTCWEKLPDNRVGKQVDCPDHVMNGRDRGGSQCSSLRITQLGQCLAADGAGKKR